MFRYRWIAFITFFCIIITSSAMPVFVFAESKNKYEDREMGTAAKSSILVDAGSGRVLHEHNSHERLPPASITKIMTMLLVLEAIERGQIAIKDRVTISERASSMGGSQMYLEQGEEQTVETLLKGMAIGSANDACVACAEYVGGTEQIFVEMMNKRAKELGMKDTHFVNTNGLPAEKHYTSANDIAIMSKELLKHEISIEWFKIWQTTVMVGLKGKKQTEFGLTNTNRLIKLYPDANGIKTGFTQEAGYCLSGSATRNGLTLVAVVLGCETTQIRWGETMKLLDYGFATYESVKIAEKEKTLGSIFVDKGSPSEVKAITEDDISVLIKKGESDSISKKTVLFKGINAPLSAGDQVGELVVFQNEKEIGRYPLIAKSKVSQVGLPEIYLRMLKSLV